MLSLAGPQHYRDEAKRLRKKAEEAETPHARNRLQKIARVYDRLAASVEKEMKPRWPAWEPIGSGTVSKERDFP